MTAPRTLPPADLQQLLSLFQTRRFGAMAQLARSLLDRYPEAGMGWKALGIALQAQGQDAVDALAAARARPLPNLHIAIGPLPATARGHITLGVPVLTLAGTSALARQGESILQNVGLPDWIATDPDDYIARAARHAGDVDALAALRQGLRRQLLASTLCDSHRFVHHFARALQAMNKQEQTPRVPSQRP